MASLHRHQLARLSDAGWDTALGQPRDASDRSARDCLDHWAAHRLPLVVTRQSADAAIGGWIALGLPAPLRWERRRLALRLPAAAVLRFDEFPCLADVQGLLPASARAAVRELLDGFGACRATARVFGSYGWQAISGLDHVRPGSDLDLSISVDGPAQADAVSRHLQSFGAERLRLDGELAFGNGAAVAWREWADWRAGRARAVMVRRLDGLALHRDADFAGCGHGAPAGADA